jgi:hypothetical protein
MPTTKLTQVAVEKLKRRSRAGWNTGIRSFLDSGFGYPTAAGRPGSRCTVSAASWYERRSALQRLSQMSRKRGSVLGKACRKRRLSRTLLSGDASASGNGRL